MTLHDFLRNRAPTRANPNPANDTEVEWSLWASASGGPEQDRTWHEVERFSAPSLEPVAQKRAAEEFMAAPSWAARPGDLVKLRAKEGRTEGFFVFVDENRGLQGLIAPRVQAVWDPAMDPEAIAFPARQWCTQLGWDWGAGFTPVEGTRRVYPEFWVALGAGLGLRLEALRAVHEGLAELVANGAPWPAACHEVYAVLTLGVAECVAAHDAVWRGMQARLDRRTLPPGSSSKFPASTALEVLRCAVEGVRDGVGLARAMRHLTNLLQQDPKGLWPDREEEHVRARADLMARAQRHLSVPRMVEQASREARARGALP